MEDQTDVIGSSTAENKELGRTVNESRQQNLSEMTSLTVSSTPGPSSSQTDEDYNDSLNNSSSSKETCSSKSSAEKFEPRRIMDVKKKYNIPEMTASTVSPMPEMNPNDDSSNDTLKDKCNTKELSSVSFLGTFYLFLCCICNGLVSVIVKKIPYMHPTQLALIRFVGISVFALPFAVYTAKKGLNKKEGFLLLARGLFIASAQYATIIAYRNMPIAEVAAVSAAQPVVTAVLARLLIKESCGLVMLISMMINILGVLVSIRIPEIILNRNNVQMSSQYLIGLAAAISVPVLYAHSVKGERCSLFSTDIMF